MAIICDSYSESNKSGDSSLNSTANVAYGQTFTGDGGVLNSVKFYIGKQNSPTGSGYAKIYAHTGTFGSTGVPTGAVLATSDAFDISTVISGYGNYELAEITFSGENKITLTDTIKYCVIFDISLANTDNTNRTTMGVDVTTPTHAGNGILYNGSTWSVQSWDACFYVYVDDPTTTSSSSSSSTSSTSSSTSSTSSSTSSTSSSSSTSSTSSSSSTSSTSSSSSSSTSSTSSSSSTSSTSSSSTSSTSSTTIMYLHHKFDIWNEAKTEGGEVRRV